MAAMAEQPAAVSHAKYCGGLPSIPDWYSRFTELYADLSRQLTGGSLARQIGETLAQSNDWQLRKLWTLLVGLNSRQQQTDIVEAAVEASAAEALDGKFGKIETPLAIPVVHTLMGLVSRAERDLREKLLSFSSLQQVWQKVMWLIQFHQASLIEQAEKDVADHENALNAVVEESSIAATDNPLTPAAKRTLSNRVATLKASVVLLKAQFADLQPINDAVAGISGIARSATAATASRATVIFQARANQLNAMSTLSS